MSVKLESDDDAFSISSTAPSEVRETYPLEKILAERSTEDDSGSGEVKEYLVKWDGYGLDRSTWEPGDNFEDKVSLFLWQEQQMRETRGLAVPFDVEAWEDRQDEIREAKCERHARRNRKRAKLGLPVSIWSEENEDAEASPCDEEGLPTLLLESSLSDSTDDTPIIARRKAPIYDTSDSDIPIASLKRQKSQLSEQVHKKPSLTRKPRIGQAIHTKGTSQIPSTSVPKDGAANPPHASSAIIPRSAPAVAGWFNSFQPTPTTAPRPASGPVVNKVGATQTTTQDGRPLMKRTAPTRKASVQQPGPISFTYNKPEPKLAIRTTAARNLSHRNNIMKKGREERAPATGALNLYNPATGDVVSVATTSAPERQALPAVSGTVSQVTIVPAAAPTTVTPAPTDPPGGSRAFTNTSDPVLDNRPYTCWFWATPNGCAHRSTCEYQHYDTGRTAPAYNDFRGKDMTCPYWWRSQCFKSEQECKFAHRRTNYLAGTGNSQPYSAVLSPDAIRPSGATMSPLPRADNPSGLRPRSKKPRFTCWFWYHGRCVKSSADCQFAHEDTGYVADRHGGPAIPTPKRPLDLHTFMETNPLSSDAEHSWDSPMHSGSRVSRPISPSTNPAYYNLDQRRGTIGPRTGVILTEKTTGINHFASLVVRLLVEPPGSHKDERLDIEAKMTDLDDDAKDWFLGEFAGAGTPCLVMRHICVASMMKAYLDTDRYPVFASGSLSSLENDVLSLKLLSDNLKMYSAGALISQPNYNIIVHPVGGHEWDFLGSDTSEPHAVLRFHITKPFFTPLADNDSNNHGRKIIDKDKLLASLNNKKALKTVFLIYPTAKHHPELDTLTKTFQDLGINVYHGSVPGAWDYFRTHCDASVVLIHEEFHDYQDIPYLAYLANVPTLPIFSLISNEDPTEPVFSTQRLLPHGRAYLIMDECFVNYPKETLEVTRQLVGRANTVAPFYRILGRPGLVNWLRDLARQNESTSSTPADGERRHAHIVSIFQKLLASNPTYMEPYDRPTPSKHSPLFFLPEHKWPGYAETWKRDERAAANELADWFAAWAILHINEFRKIVILTHADEKTKEMWEKRFGHLSVLNPAEWLREEDRKHRKSDGAKR